MEDRHEATRKPYDHPGLRHRLRCLAGRQLHALATGAWEALDVPHLCDELDGVRRHYLQELEWSLIQLIEARLVWDYALEERSDWWQGHMNDTHSHLETFLDGETVFREVLGRRYPVLYQHAIHALQRYYRLDPARWPRVPPWPVEALIEDYQTVPDAWREAGPQTLQETEAQP